MSIRDVRTLTGIIAVAAFVAACNDNTMPTGIAASGVIPYACHDYFSVFGSDHRCGEGSYSYTWLKGRASGVGVE